MNKRLIISIAVLSIAIPTAVLADAQSRKAEEMCTGKKSSEDYPRWTLLTNTCADNNVDICSIKKKNGDLATYQCTAADRTVSSSGGSGGKKTPKPQHEN
ncbi:MAG: hypothetical protein DHS20C05_20350 [Hyphococcus sp.]|nr:MAG: hypothetical protein DHS20C05_20350 [Marinicaulis sp.]